MSGVGSVTRVPIGVFRSVSESRALLESAVREVLVLAQTLGVGLTEEDAERGLAFIDTVPTEGTSSMQRDFGDGRRTELDALSGAVVRLSAKAGIRSPAHEFIYRSLLPLELAARGELPGTTADQD